MIRSKIIFGTLASFALAMISGGAPAYAATATFQSPEYEPDAAALSTPGDNAGALVTSLASLMLLFDQPFATAKSDNVSIFTLAPASGTARARVRFGSFNNGSPIFVADRVVNAGGTLTFSNLFQKGCSTFGGCDFIEIIIERTTGGATGVEVDYVDINGQTTTVTAPTPEPATWVMMILGFVLIAARLKQKRVSENRARKVAEIMPAGWLATPSGT